MFRIERVGRRLGFIAIGGVVALVIACGGSGDDAAADQPADTLPTPAVAPSPTATPDPVPTVTPEESTVEPSATDATSSEVEPTSTARSELQIEDDAERSRAERLRSIWGWGTDFNKRTIALNELEIVLPRDRIASIDEPTFLSVSNPPDYMDPREPVVAVIVNGEAKAYPLAMLMWHEIVNDTIGGIPVTVTFCPLCNTGITFERIVDGRELMFGTSGMLRNSDLVMWDRETESLWQQITGEALAGEFAGNETVLMQIPSSIIAWETFADSYPDGQLLERTNNEFGQPLRPYDSPPYAGYDDVDNPPFLFRGVVDDRLVATSRVLTIDGETPVAYPFAFLKETPVLNDSTGGEDIVALFDYETFSAFNNLSNTRQKSGSVAVFSRTVDGRFLTFEFTDSIITDTETGSVWNLAGLAVSGELAGTRLTPIVHANHFWFAWAVFKPNTEIRDSLDDLAS